MRKDAKIVATAARSPHVADLSRAAPAPTYKAAKELLAFLIDAEPSTGFKPRAESRIDALPNEGGISGHCLLLPLAGKGLPDERLKVIESYAQSLTYWRNLLVEVQNDENAVKVTFISPQAPEPEAEEVEPKLRLRERLAPRDLKAARNTGRLLVGLGFKVREPVAASVFTLTENYSGYALMVRYPFATAKDEAGVTQVYDRMLPLIADAYAREHGLKSETVREAGITTVFFTRSRRYLSSLYDPYPKVRLIVPRIKSMSDVGDRLFPGVTYRACRALMKQYKRDFDMVRRPIPALGVLGHRVVMQYKRGASGKLVDDSYMLTIGRMAHMLMDKYGLRASVNHQAMTRCLVVTFYKGTVGDWGSDVPRFGVVSNLRSDQGAEIPR
jgi:hypothetical protein